MQKDTNNLGSENIIKLVFKLSLPAITAQIINLLYSIVDRMYIGHIDIIGKDALTGVGVAFPVLMLISAFSALIGMGGAPKAAIKMGKNEYDEAEKILGTCFGSLVIVSTVLTTLIIIFQRPLLLLFGASSVTIEYATDYLTIYAMGTIFVQLVLGLNTFITCQGFASVGMKTTVIGALINIVLDPIFIYLLNLGVKGAALATVISQAVSCIWVLKFLTGNKTTLKIKKEYIIPDKKIALSVMALGISPFIMQSTESLISICFNSRLQVYGGDIAVGSVTILTSIMQFAILPSIGLTGGCQPIISYNFGAGKMDRVEKAFKVLALSCLVFTLIIWSVSVFAPELLVTIFTSDQILIESAKWALRVYIFGIGFFGVQIACQQTFIALGQAKISIFLAIFRKIIVLIPLVFILPTIIPAEIGLQFIPESIIPLFKEPSKVLSVFLAEPVADILAIICTVAFFAVNFKKILKKGAV